MSKWHVICEPVHDGQDTGTDQKNEGGLIVQLREGVSGTPREVSRVAFNRKNGSQPRMGFDKALQKELEKAQSAAETMNRLQAEADKLHRAADEADAKLRTASPVGGRTPLR